MSIQETKLTEIADAIRYAESSTGPVPAPDYPKRIRALKGGGSSEGGCIEVLENWQGDKEYFVGYIRQADFSSTVSVPLGYEILEGYV